MNNNNHDTLDYIIQHTCNTTILWENSAAAAAPQTVIKKMDAAMLGWMRDLTQTLRLWADKGSSMTDGELILARANLGAVVESWLKLFFCAYNDDYQKNPKTDYKGAVIEPNDLGFEQLKQFSHGKLFISGDAFDVWINSVQNKRNAIHSFNKREIGTATDYYNDLEILYDFIKKLTLQLPPIEDAYDNQPYPSGYEQPYLEQYRMLVKQV